MINLIRLSSIRSRAYQRSIWLLIVVPGCGLEHAVDAWNEKPASEASTGGEGGTTTSDASSSTGGSGAFDGSSEAGGVDTDMVLATGTSAETGDPAASSGGPETATGEPVGCSAEAECDDSKQVGCYNCIRDRLVFVTSQQVQGNFGSMPGLDDLCNQLAAKAGLLIDNKKRFSVWISTSEIDAVDRFYHSPGRYVLTNGEIFAESWDAIIAGEILRPLNVDENGSEMNSIVWTDTLPNGRRVTDSTHCDDWSSNQLATEANYGYSSKSDGQWTRVSDGTSPTYCAEDAALYCFEFE